MNNATKIMKVQALVSWANARCRKALDLRDKAKTHTVRKAFQQDAENFLEMSCALTELNDMLKHEDEAIAMLAMVERDQTNATLN